MPSPVTIAKLEKLIKNGREAGKDVSKLEEQLEELKNSPISTSPTKWPGREEDFTP